MVEAEELGAIARRVIDSNQFMTIGTADEEGVPWASPVWYAVADYREFFWVSSPEARHWRNIRVRPQVAIVIFDSRAPEGPPRPSTSRRRPRSSRERASSGASASFPVRPPRRGES